MRTVGHEPLIVPTDLSSEEQCRRIADRAIEHFGGVDVFVQNGHHDGDWTEVVDADVADWRHIMDVNFFGAFTISQRVVPSMIERGGGRVVLVQHGRGVQQPPRARRLRGVEGRTGEPGPHDGRRARALGRAGEQRDARAGAGCEHHAGDRAARHERRRARARRREGEDAAAGAHADARRVRRRVLFLVALAAAITGQNIVVNGGQWVTV